MHVKIENYQSIKEAEFEVKGLTVITGPNNTGKSACARAIAGAFSNARGHSHVRKGEKYSKVSIDFDDGNTVIWEKGKSTNRYEINGNKLERVGAKTPDELADLKITSVDVDGKTVWPQIAKQFEQIFLLNLPPSVLSSALSDVKTIEALEKASSLSRNETRSINNRIKIKHEDLEIERKRLPAFNEVEIAESAVSHISKVQNELDSLNQRIEKLLTIKTKREELMYQTQFLTSVKNINFPKVQAQDFMDIKDLERIRKEKVKLRVLEGVVGVGLTSYPEIPETKVKEHQPLERVLKKRNQLNETIKTISSIYEKFDIPNVDSQVEKDLEIASERFDLHKRIMNTESEIKRLTDELDSLKCEIGDTCPLCEQGINH